MAASQRLSQLDVQLQGHLVTNYFANMQQRDDAMVQNFKACRDAVMEAAQLYADEKDSAKLTALRQQLLSVVQAEQQVSLHRAALGELHQRYQPSLEQTDFAARLQEHMDEAQGLANFDAEADEDVVEFDAVAGGPGTQQGQDQEQLEDDEDLVAVGHVDKNEKCPYTMRDVADLDEPLEDHKGFIYEAVAIRRALQQGGIGWIECPCPGVSHRITAANLKPANKRRLARLGKQRRAAQQQAATQAGASRVVIDI